MSKRGIDQVSNSALAGPPLKLRHVPFDYPSLCAELADHIRSFLTQNEDWATLICLSLTCCDEYKLRRTFTNLKRDFLAAVCSKGYVQLHGQFLNGSILHGYTFDNTVDKDIYHAACNNQVEMVNYLHTLKLNRFCFISQNSSLAIVGAAHCKNREMIDFFVDRDYQLDDLALSAVFGCIPTNTIRSFITAMRRIRGKSGYSIGIFCLPIMLKLDREWATQMWRETHGHFGFDFVDTVIETQSCSSVRKILQPIALRRDNIIGPDTFKTAALTGDIDKLRLVVTLNRHQYQNDSDTLPFDVVVAAASHGDIELMKFVFNLPRTNGLAISYEPLMLLTMVARSGNLETFKWLDLHAKQLFSTAYKNFELNANIRMQYSIIMVGAIRSSNWDMIHLVDSLGLFNNPESDGIAYMAAVKHSDNSILDWLYDTKMLQWSDAAFIGLLNFKFETNALSPERMIKVLKWLIAHTFEWTSVNDFYQLLHLDSTSNYYKVKIWMMKQPYFDAIFTTPIQTVIDSMDKAFEVFDTNDTNDQHEVHYSRLKLLWMDTI